MARKPIAPLELVTVRHRDTGRAVSWCNGTFSGDAELVAAARAIHEAGEAGQSVSLGPVEFALTDDPRGAAAAMMAACCGRGMLITDPSVLTADV